MDTKENKTAPQFNFGKLASLCDNRASRIKIMNEFHKIYSMIEYVVCSTNADLNIFDNENSVKEKEVLENYKDEDEIVRNHYASEAVSCCEDFEGEIFDIKQKFLHASFCITYSYFESTICSLLKLKKINKSTKAFVLDKLKTNNSKNDFLYIWDRIRLIRNLLIHNYCLSSDLKEINDDLIDCYNEQINTAKIESNRKEGFSYYANGNTFSFTKDYILNLLIKEKQILCVFRPIVGHSFR